MFVLSITNNYKTDKNVKEQLLQANFIFQIQEVDQPIDKTNSLVFNWTIDSDIYVTNSQELYESLFYDD